MPPYDYDPSHIAFVLADVNTIALVGASANRAKASNDVMRFLLARGYEVIPVNPAPGLEEIEGRKVYPDLVSIDCPVDMVDVFRPKAEFAAIADQAILIKAGVLWGQLDIFDDAAAAKAEAAGLKVIMDRCPKIELARDA